MIQEDIGGHPPIPLAPPTIVSFIFPVSLIVAQFTIFGSFRVLSLWGRFEALNDVFLASNGLRLLPMGDEKKDEGIEDPIKMLLEEALEIQRNAMMDNFVEILQRLPTSGTSTSSSHYRGTTPFKV